MNAADAAQALVISKARKPGSMQRGGLFTNVDLVDLRPDQREAAEEYERNVEATKEVFAESDGTNSFLGMRDTQAAGMGTVSKRQLTMTYEDVMEQRRRGEKVIPVYYDPVADCWVLPDEYKVAWAAGYICQACLEWQEVPHSKVCRTLHGGFSCGHVNHDNPL